MAQPNIRSSGSGSGDWADREAAEFMRWIRCGIDLFDLAEAQLAERLRRAYAKGGLDACERLHRGVIDAAGMVS